jgi:hypothetical protein
MSIKKSIFPFLLAIFKSSTLLPEADKAPFKKATLFLYVLGFSLIT